MPIGPHSLTARMANEEARREAFARARELARQAEQAAEDARQREDLLIASAMETIIQLLD